MNKVDRNHICDSVDGQQRERRPDEVSEHKGEERKRFPELGKQRIHLECHPARVVDHHSESDNSSERDEICPEQLYATNNLCFIMPFEKLF